MYGIGRFVCLVQHSVFTCSSILNVYIIFPFFRYLTSCIPFFYPNLYFSYMVKSWVITKFNKTTTFYFFLSFDLRNSFDCPPLTEGMPCRIKDTSHLLNIIDDLFKDYISDNYILVSFHIGNMYPGIDSVRGIAAITSISNMRETKLPST